MIKAIIIPARETLQNLNKISLRYTYKRRFVLFSLNLYVNKNDWNSITGTFKKSADNYKEKSELLKKEILKLEKIIIDLQLEDIEPTILNVKDKYKYNKTYINRPTIKDIINDNKTVLNDIDFYKEYNSFLAERKATKKINNATFESNNLTLKRLKLFEQKHNIAVRFSNIDKTFYNKFVEYLYNLGITDNTIDTHIKHLKTFLKYSAEKGSHSNMIFMGFERLTRQSKIIALEYQELINLYKVKTENEIEILIKDLAILQLNSGLRYTDLKNLKNFNFKTEYSGKNIITERSYIEVLTNKTGENITIPFNSAIEYYFKKYVQNKTLNITINNQIFNDYLSKLCQRAKINEPTEVYTFRGNEKKTEIKAKYKLITSHTLRKTFISQSLRGAMPATVMSVTGHKSYNAFKRYISMGNDSKRDVMFTLNSAFSVFEEKNISKK